MPQAGLVEGGARLERSKDEFKERVKGMLEAFLRELAGMQEDFARGAPYSHEHTTCHDALAFVTKWRTTLTAARTKVRCCMRSTTH